MPGVQLPALDAVAAVERTVTLRRCGNAFPISLRRANIDDLDQSRAVVFVKPSDGHQNGMPTASEVR